METKYVMMDNLGSFGGIDRFLIFPAFEEHKSVVERYGGKGHLLSAGFVRLSYEDGKIVAQCYGNSWSLGVGPRKIDSKIITIFLNNS